MAEQGSLSHAEHAELVAIAEIAARKAGEIALSVFASSAGAVHKGEVDLVTEADLRCEKAIREHLIDATDFGVLGEEGGVSGCADGAIWVVDPIDGTTNFAHRVPHFAISIGLWHEGARCGVIYDPCRGELFASSATGLRVNGAAVPALAPSPMNSALLASGFPYDRRTTDDDNTDLWRAMMKRCQGVRRNGAAALDMAWTAAGRFDGFWEPRLEPWDVVAGIALVEVAGATATSYEGAPWTLQTKSIVAAHPALHRELIELIARVRSS